MLYFIPTPIGNKDDITLRAITLLQSLEFFFCEDSRTLKKLMGMHNIPTTNKHFFSLTSFTNTHEFAKYADILKTSDVGLTSEAGTPGLSDPGKSMIQLCQENNIPYTILPGANALVPAIVGAGFDTSNFIYLGFFPQKKGRQTLLKRICSGGYEDTPVFFYESVHRVEKLIKELTEFGFTGKIHIARELSKMFEQHLTGTLPEISEAIQQKKIAIKGEFVIGLRREKE